MRRRMETQRPVNAPDNDSPETTIDATLLAVADAMATAATLVRRLGETDPGVERRRTLGGVSGHPPFGHAPR